MAVARRMYWLSLAPAAARGYLTCLALYSLSPSLSLNQLSLSSRSLSSLASRFVLWRER